MHSVNVYKRKRSLNVYKTFIKRLQNVPRVFHPLVTPVCNGLFLLHHVCQAYRTVNERMRTKGHNIVPKNKKVDFESSKYEDKLKNDRIEDDSDQEKFLDKLIPLLLMNEVTF
jgi:hypothetical protein